MSHLAKRGEAELALYPPITRLLEKQGLCVWEQATIRAGDEGTRTSDHVAWRWDGKEIEAVAVEVKAGKADVGLAQAIAYGVGFQRVYVAAEEALSDTGYIAKVLDRLGLGYIEVSRRRASIQREASKSAFITKEVRDENLGRIRLKHLWNDKVVGEPTYFGRDRRPPIWGVTGKTSEWQICVTLYPGGTHALLSLIAESKGFGDRVASRLAPAEFAGVLKELGDDEVEVHLQRREYKFQPRYEPKRVWRQTDGVPALGRLLAAARAISGPSVGPWFEIRTDLWPHAVRLTETSARHELRTRIDRMRPIRDKLNRIV